MSILPRTCAKSRLQRASRASPPSCPAQLPSPVAQPSCPVQLPSPAAQPSCPKCPTSSRHRAPFSASRLKPPKSHSLALAQSSHRVSPVQPSPASSASPASPAHSHLIAIYTGFKSIHVFTAGICMGFYMVPLKTHAPVHKRCLLGLKTHAFCNDKTSSGLQKRAKTS